MRLSFHTFTRGPGTRILECAPGLMHAVVPPPVSAPQRAAHRAPDADRSVLRPRASRTSSAPRHRMAAPHAWSACSPQIPRKKTEEETSQPAHLVLLLPLLEGGELPGGAHPLAPVLRVPHPLVQRLQPRLLLGAELGPRLMRRQHRDVNLRPESARSPSPPFRSPGRAARPRVVRLVAQVRRPLGPANAEAAPWSAPRSSDTTRTRPPGSRAARRAAPAPTRQAPKPTQLQRSRCKDPDAKIQISPPPGRGPGGAPPPAPPQPRRRGFYEQLFGRRLAGPPQTDDDRLRFPRARSCGRPPSQETPRR